MKILKSKKIIIVIAILVTLIAIFGSTYAYWTWRSASNTMVNFTVTSDFSCSADGGGNITGSGISLIPATCTNTDHVIKRTITTNVNKLGSNNVYMDLWLNINSIGSYLANNADFKYTLSTTDSCTTNIIANGTFASLSAGGKIQLLNKKEHTTSASNKYYLYIWLNKAEETIPPTDTAARQINLTLDGECTNEN